MRSGGVLLIFGGVAGIVAFGTICAVIRCELLIGQQAYGCGGGFRLLSDAARGAGLLSVCAGLFGFYALAAEAPGYLRVAARAGIFLFALSTMFHVWGFAGESYARFFDERYVALPPFSVPPGGWQLLWLLFVCACAPWSRRMGLWRWLPPGIWLVYLLPPQLFLSAITDSEPGKIFFVNGSLMSDGTLLGTVAFELPQAIVSVGWFFVGLSLFGTRKRAERDTYKERIATQGANLSLAYTLYSEAWKEGNLSVVESIASDDILDRRRNRSGIAPFERAIRGLRESFPDLYVEIVSQTASGDSVTTRLLLSGTDLGGVLWYPPTGRTATFTGKFTDRFECGKLVEHDGETDEESLMEQLGLRRG